MEQNLLLTRTGVDPHCTGGLEDIMSNNVQILNGQPMTGGGNTRSRKARRKPNRVQGNNVRRPQQQKQTKARKPPRKKGISDKRLRDVLEDFGECGVLYAKAVQDPFHFVNAGSKLPCVPSGPKVKTKRVAVWRRGRFNTNSAGNGFIALSPYKIMSDIGPLASNDDPIWWSTNLYSTTTVASPVTAGAGVAGDKFLNSGIVIAQDPTMRIVAAGLRVQCNGPPLYTSGQMAYCQLPNITDSWRDRNIFDLLNFPEASVHRVDHEPHTYTWRFASNRPQTVVSEQQEFMDYTRMNAFDGHNMLVTITGAPGSGNGLEFRYEAIVLVEIISLSDGTNRTPPVEAIFTDSAPKAQEYVNQYAQEARGVVSGTTIKTVLDSVSQIHAKSMQAADAVHTVTNLMQHLKM